MRYNDQRRCCINPNLASVSATQWNTALKKKLCFWIVRDTVTRCFSGKNTVRFDTHPDRRAGKDFCGLASNRCQKMTRSRQDIGLCIVDVSAVYIHLSNDPYRSSMHRSQWFVACSTGVVVEFNSYTPDTFPLTTDGWGRRNREPV